MAWLQAQWRKHRSYIKQNMYYTGRYPIIRCLLSVCFDDVMHGRYASFYVNKGIKVAHCARRQLHVHKNLSVCLWSVGVSGQDRAQLSIIGSVFAWYRLRLKWQAVLRIKTAVLNMSKIFLASRVLGTTGLLVTEVPSIYKFINDWI